MRGTTISIENDKQGSCVVYFSGSLTEDSELSPAAALPSEKSLTLDMLNLKSINSTGIRLFMGWAGEIGAKELFLQNCPAVFVHQMNAIMNFLPAHARIKSFFVPYYSPDTDTEIQVLYKRGVDFMRSDAGEMKVVHPPVPKEGKWEIDVNPERYFNFLERYA